MSLEALFSLLALLIALSMLPSAQQECEAGALLQAQKAQDVASVLEKTGAIDWFAQWAAGDGEEGKFAAKLQQTADAAGGCVGLYAQGKSAQACAGGKGQSAGSVVHATRRIAVLKGGFGEVMVRVWGRQ